MSAIKIYVGCALTSAPLEFREKVEKFKNKLRDKGFEVFDFLGLVKGTPKDVYNWDIKKCVAECDLFVAVMEHQSIGLGYELATILEKHNKPALAIAEKGKLVTRLALGIDHPKYSFQEYETLDDAVLLVVEKAKEISIN